jgi:DNA adenine methylase
MNKFNLNKFNLKELITLCEKHNIEYLVPKKNGNGNKKKSKKELINLLKDVLKIDEPLNPLFKWSGGKKDEIKYIVDHIPKDYDTYLEPFFGGGALFFYLKPHKSAISDVHEELISFYKEIQNNNSDKIIDFMDKHPNNSDTYYNVRSMKTNNNLDIACKFFYLRKTCYRGMIRYNKNGGFNIPYGKYKNINYDYLNNTKYEKLLLNCDIHMGDFEYIFKKYDNENNFMFLDPPYDTPFSNYGFSSFGREEHKRLASLFKKSKCKCLMIISETDFIKKLYENYIVDTFDKKYKFRLHSDRINSDNIDKPHLIIKNYQN